MLFFHFTHLTSILEKFKLMLITKTDKVQVGSCPVLHLFFSVKVMCVDLGNLICVSGASPTVLFIDDTVPTTHKCISYIPPTVLQRMGPPYSMKKASMRIFICQTTRFSQSPSLREPHQFKRCGMHNKRRWKTITMRRQRGYICALYYFA